MKHIFLSICLLGFSISEAHADLRYKINLEVRSISPGLTAAVSATETVMLIRGDAIRIEQVQGATRSVLLTRPDGQFVLDLEARTFWRIPEMQAVLMATTTGASPTFRRTGELTTILGLQAERVEVTMSVPLPITPPPGVPTIVPMTGELWLADAYRAYAENIRRAMGPLGAVTAGMDGIVLRQVVRNAQFGIEIEHQVTEFIEAPVATEMFEVPEGFRRIIDPRASR